MRVDPLVRAAARERLRIRHRSQVKLATCTHPVDCLRHDGLWFADGSVYAQVTCLIERGGCGTSRVIRVRDDVAARALREQAAKDAGQGAADVLWSTGHETDGATDGAENPAHFPPKGA